MSRSRATGLALGFLADRILGDPARAHPVAAFGQVAAAVEARAYADSRLRGSLVTGGLVASTALGGVVLDRVTRSRPVLHTLVTSIATWTVLGGTSLDREAGRVDRLLAAGDLPAARDQLTHLVGRDTQQLDQGEVARATIESLAENTSDAVVAPLVLGAFGGVGALLGLPGRQHPRCHVRPPQPPLPALRLGRRTAGRRTEPPRITAHSRAGRSPRTHSAGLLARGRARLAAGLPRSPQSQRGTGGGGVRGRSRSPARRDQRLRRTRGATGAARHRQGSACRRHRARPRAGTPRRHRGPAGHGRARRHPSGEEAMTQHQAGAPGRGYDVRRRQDDRDHRPVPGPGATGSAGGALQGAEHVEQLDGVRQRRRDRPGPVGAGAGGTSRAGDRDEPGTAQAGR